MKFLLVTIGSHGDVHPFIGIGRTLCARGHDVTVMANAHFEHAILAERLGFAPLGTEEDYQRLTANPDLWSVRKGAKVVFESTLEILPPVYAAILEFMNANPDATVASSSLCLAARIAQDMLHFRMATVHLSPGVFRSVYEMPKLPGLPMPSWAPQEIKRKFWEGADRFFVDPLIAPKLNAFRAGVGLDPVTGILNHWWHSPDLVIAMFPDWYAAVQPDWPAQVRQTGFPLYDERGVAPMPDELSRFLEGGTAPIAFTPGSAMWQGHSFFKAAVTACQRLGRRGILLSRQRDHIPKDLPAEVIYIPFAPFSELLPRCAALVHHGGIGTTAQAMQAGVPQLIMHLTHDQPDNAARVKRLGVGEAISRRAFWGWRVAGKLRMLFDSPDVARNCRELSARFRTGHPLDETCKLLEELAMRQTTQFSTSQSTPV